MPPRSPRRRRGAFALLIVLVAIYNANGREIGAIDTQPTKFAAREFALHGRLTLDDVVAATPALADRVSYQRDRDGHVRSAYSIVPSLEAAIPASLLHVTRLVNLRAPLAPNLIAVLTASALTASAVVLVFLTVRRTSDERSAWLVALALGLGTNCWLVGAKTLYGHETVLFGLALALHAWCRRPDDTSARHVWIGAIGLGLAGAARPQTAPIVAIVLASEVARLTVRRAWPAVAVVAAAAAALAAYQYAYFGHVLGATPVLEGLHPQLHGVDGTWSATPWIGAAGLLVSPNRGLLIFSPVVLVAVIGVRDAWRRDDGLGRRAWLAAAALQFALYADYSVWWGGHTFGPRYVVDLLVPLAVAAPEGLARLRAVRWGRALAIAALVWSIAVSATGVWCYPNDQWNMDPTDVDQYHERLWTWRDSQIARAWSRGPDPRTFDLFSRWAVRPDQE